MVACGSPYLPWLQFGNMMMSQLQKQQMFEKFCNFDNENIRNTLIRNMRNYLKFPAWNSFESLGQ